MLLALETYRPWQYYGLSVGLKMIREAGFSAVDFSFYWDAAKAFLGDDYIERAYEIKEALEKNGLTCHQAHAPFSLTYDMKLDDSCFDFLSVKRSIEACGIIGIDHIVVHGIPTPVPPASYLNMEYNLAYYRSLEPLCEKYGVKIAIENLSGSFTYPDLLNEILRKLDSPWFTALVDIGHAWLRAGIQPGNFIRQLDPGILGGLHVHDNHGPECHKDEHLAPYMGTIDYDDFFRALKETGYQGDMTMECVQFLDFYAKEGLLKEALVFEKAIGEKLIEKLETM